MSHTVGMSTTDYVWDVAAGLPVVLDDGENTYVYGLDLISAVDSQSDETYFLYDGLGSVANVTDDSGSVVASYSYDVFGAIRSQTGSSDNYWLFTGEQHDASEGLYYLRSRQYDPETGRFLGRDGWVGSASNPASQNRYAYVLNNPCTWIDPSGFVPVEPPTASSIVCEFSGKVEGIGAYQVPEVPFIPDPCDWTGICPKIYPDDILFEFEGSVIFSIDELGWSADSLVHQFGTQYGWGADGWTSAKEGDAFGVKLDYSGGPLDLDASVYLLFELSDHGISAHGVFLVDAWWPKSITGDTLTFSVDITCH